MATIGFISVCGLSVPLAESLVKAGHKVTLYAPNIKNPHLLAAEGAKQVMTLAEAIQNADFIISLLWSTQQVTSLCMDDGLLFDSMQKTSIYIDMSTIDAKKSCLLHSKAEELGIKMLDAPVVGDPIRAASKDISILVGGAPDDVATAQSILQAMAERVINVGTAGSGLVCKLCDSMILGVAMVAYSEILNMANDLGLEYKKVIDVLSKTAPQDRVLSDYCPVPGVVADAPSSHEYKAQIATEDMLRDLKLSRDVSDNVNSRTQIVTQAASIYNDYIDRGNAEHDFSGIFQMLKENKV